MIEATEQDFLDNVTIEKDGDRLNIECKKGLWGVDAPSDRALSEARHYFIQYWDDGEYSK